MQFIQVFLKFITISGLLVICNGKFISSPNAENLRIPLKQSIDLTCKYDDVKGTGDFLEWYRDNSSVALEKPGHYVVHTTPTETTLSILIFVSSDEQIKEWYVTSSKSNDPDKKACSFGQVKLVPSPQEMLTNAEKKPLTTNGESIRRIEGESVELTCIIKPELERLMDRNKILWHYSQDGINFVSAHDSGEIIEGDRFTIADIQKHHRGFYRCTLNNVSFTVQLRVKDRLAALWPFLGIVAIVLILVIIIIIFEKRQKSNQRTTATDEDDHDHANDPLVRQTNKSSDNENKKRTVKA